MERKTLHRSRPALFLWALLGLGAGFLNGLLGAAGGILLVTILPHMPQFPYGQVLVPPPEGRAVFVTGLWVMVPATAVSALLYFVRGMSGTPSQALIIAPTAALGGLVGAILLNKLPQRFFRRLFGLLVLFAGIRMMLS